MSKGTLTMVDSDKSYLWEEDAEDAQPEIEVTPYIDRKLKKYGYWWKYLPDIDYWLLVGPGGYCRTVWGALEEIQQRLGYRKRGKGEESRNT